MTDISRSSIFDALDQVQVPETGKSPVKLKAVRGLDISDDGHVTITLHLPGMPEDARKTFQSNIENALQQVQGVAAVTMEIRETKAEDRQVKRENLLPNVQWPILVGSGKGGVGKSTVTVNLAISLAAMGFSVGLLDGDLYGPSVPTMFGIQERPLANAAGQLIPFERYGVKLISIGFLLEEGTPVIWRGPILHKAIQQLMKDVAWGDLDFLLIDLPPGTGDVQISISQSTHVAGAIAVTTPQDVALIDVKKAITMFETLEIPMLGVVENMSYFRCTECDATHYIFSGNRNNGTGDQLAAPVIGRIPIQISVRSGGDEGTPVVVQDPESEAADIFRDLAGTVAKAIRSSYNA